MLEKPHSAKCAVCGFWNNSRSSATSDFETGACQRNPPGFDDRDGMAVWPFTEEDDWCGEFKMNQDARDAEEEDESHG